MDAVKQKVAAVAGDGADSAWKIADASKIAD
jgi:hypothetical protein